ncbi:hypothetical protein [Bradyrhizobium sp.]|uniref:hypothetical protein n=1 Tax=Bradyrhizobium sp. TaxID=376 RepID=UPI003C31215E
MITLMETYNADTGKYAISGRFALLSRALREMDAYRAKFADAQLTLSGGGPNDYHHVQGERAPMFGVSK